MSDEQPQLPPKVGHVLLLAGIIREVDGGNRLGAAALAEAILSHRDFPGCCPAPFAPVHTSERPWERKGWLDDQGRSWFYCDIEKAWFLEKFLSIEPDGHEIRTSCFPWHLPHWAILVPADGELQP